MTKELDETMRNSIHKMRKQQFIFHKNLRMTAESKQLLRGWMQMKVEKNGIQSGEARCPMQVQFTMKQVHSLLSLAKGQGSRHLRAKIEP